MSEDKLNSMRHSLAHIMADAVGQLWPNAKYGVGPVVENGFYYDIDLGDIKISEEDFPKIEKKMKQIIKSNIKFVKSEMLVDDAIEWAVNSKQPYKQELLNDLKRSGTTSAKDIDGDELGLPTGKSSKVEKVSFYTSGSFTDLCRGPHVKKTNEIGAFRLMRVAGAYWRGKETNPQMQRLYGVAFATQEELDNYITMLEEAKKRDHRKIGQELDLFVFSDLVGQGLPLFTPRGTVLRRQLDAYVQEMRDEYGYQEVTIPHITKKDAYIASGHWAKFKDELFRITTREGHEFAMKPMNCPHHTQIYSSRSRSYRELPIRYRETTTCYRDEQSGELSGLSRLRAFTQDDAHVFCRTSQINQEVLNIWDIIDRFYGNFGFKLNVRFSTHDTDNMDAYSGTEEAWLSAENQILDIVKSKVGNDYIVGVGEAAFYGPKIDFMAKDAIGRVHQVATIQLDFNQPEGFDLFCVNENSDKERITMIHAAIMGSIDRFLSVYIEHCAGKFPVWLAPEQIRFITVNQTEPIVNYANSLVEKAKDLGLRVTADNDNESVGKKIRLAENMKIPYVVVIGEKELESDMTTPRVRGVMLVQMESPIKIDNFLKTVLNESKSRTHKTTM